MMKNFLCALTPRTLLTASLFALAACSKPAPPPPAARLTPEGHAGAVEVYKFTLRAFALDKDRAKAEVGFRKSSTLDASFVPSRQNLAQLAEEREDWDEALRWQGEVVTAGDVEASLQAKAEVARLQKIRAEWQTSAGRKAVRYGRALAGVQLLLADRQPALALKAAEAAAQIDDQRHEAYALMADAAVRLGRLPRALEFLAEAGKRAPTDKAPAVQQAIAALRTEQEYAAALAEGEKLLKGKRYDAAAEKFSRAAKLKPPSSAAALRAALAFNLAGEFDRAEALLGELVTSADLAVRREATKALADAGQLRRQHALLEEMKQQLGELKSSAENTKAEIKESQRQNDEAQREMDGQLGLHSENAPEELLAALREALGAGAEILSVAGAGNAFAIVTNQAVVRRNLPAALEKKLEGASDVRRICLGKDGSWVLLRQGNSCEFSAGFEPAFAEKLAERQRAEAGIADLDVASGAKWFIAREGGRPASNGAPDRLTQAAQKIADRSAEVARVFLASDNSWLLIDREQGISYNVTSERLKNLLRERQISSQPIAALGFIGGGGWVLVVR